VSIADSDNPLEEIVEDDAREAKRGRYGWLSLIVAALFGLFYAYDLWEALGNLFNLPVAYDALGIGDRVPWWLLWVGVLVPPLAFAIAVFVGRRRNVVGKALIFLVGLAVVAGLTLAVIALGDAILPPVLSVVGPD
jgi:hypothetical protein